VNRFRLLAFLVVLVLLAAVMISMTASASATKTITAPGGGPPPTCPTGQEAFALYDISDVTPADAPPSISVAVIGEGTQTFDVFFRPGVPNAHYKGPAPDGTTGASTQIFATWDGVFAFNQYDCEPGTPPTTTTTTTTVPPPSSTTTTSSTTLPPLSTTTTTSPSQTTTTTSQPAVPAPTTSTTVPPVLSVPGCSTCTAGNG
jgi:hypothetical protein